MSVFIIAEAGVNHNGSVVLAKKMIDVAKEAGADCIKFQTFRADRLATEAAEQADYQKNNIGERKTQKEMLSELELSDEAFGELKDYCDSVGIMFLSTPFDTESIDLLEKLNVSFWKIPSGEITNYPYLCRIAKTGESIVMSTGMSTLPEIAEAVDVLKANGAKEISLLHCTTEYPAPIHEINLQSIPFLREKFGLPVGYSDHTEGNRAAIAAVCLGAEIIEKHFTLDKNMEGPDHKASLCPAELKEFVDEIRTVEVMLGNREKKVTASEEKNRSVVRKSIVAACNIKKGEIYSEKNLTTKRPGNGISPMKWSELLGRTAKRDYKRDEQIEE